MRDNFRRLRARGNASRAIVDRVALRGFRGNGSSRRSHIALYCAIRYSMVLHETIRRHTIIHIGRHQIYNKREKGPALWENRAVSGYYISFCAYFIKLILFYKKMRDNFRRLCARGNASRAIVNRVALRGFRGNCISRRPYRVPYNL
jgi:hypothetical protein